MRPISLADFDRILALGLSEDQPELPRIGVPLDDPYGIGERPQADFVFEVERERIAALTTRIVRDRVFRRVVLDAYDKRCAITGLKLINGLGRAEVDAAHIRPVEANGPDIINNGLALSGTAHWMFDRGLIGIEDDLSIVISRHVNDRDGGRGCSIRHGGWSHHGWSGIGRTRHFSRGIGRIASSIALSECPRCANFDIRQHLRVPEGELSAKSILVSNGCEAVCPFPSPIM